MNPKVRVWAEEVRDYLRGLADGSVEPANRFFGVCWVLEDVFDIGPENMSERFCGGWEFFSGDSVYPVPSAGSYTPQQAYNYEDDLWTGPYGELRREYCDYLADCIEECLK